MSVTYQEYIQFPVDNTHNKFSYGVGLGIAFYQLIYEGSSPLPQPCQMDLSSLVFENDVKTLFKSLEANHWESRK